MLLEEFIASAGGAVAAEELTAALSPAGATAALQASDMLTSFIEGAIRAHSLGCVHLVVTASTAMHCRARQVDDGHRVILVPVGILARTRAMARRLLWHLEQGGPVISMIGSPMDEREDWELAPDLRPLLGDIEDDDAFWTESARFDARTPRSRKRDARAHNVMRHCFTYLVLHELAHLTNGHAELLQLAAAGDPRIPQDMDAATLRRGIELHADVYAALHHGRLQIRHALTRDETRKRPAPRSNRCRSRWRCCSGCTTRIARRSMTTTAAPTPTRSCATSSGTPTS